MPKNRGPVSRLSFHPLAFDEALANLLAVKPAAKSKKGRQKPKAARGKAKKDMDRKR